MWIRRLGGCHPRLCKQNKQGLRTNGTGHWKPPSDILHRNCNKSFPISVLDNSDNVRLLLVVGYGSLGYSHCVKLSKSLPFMGLSFPSKMGHFRSSLRALVPRAGHVSLDPWSSNTRSNQAAEKSPRSLLKYTPWALPQRFQFQGGTQVSDILCSAPSDPMAARRSAWDIAVTRAPGPSTVTQSIKALEEAHAECQHGLTWGVQPLGLCLV